MIELPEAIRIAGQIRTEVAGKRIRTAVRGNSPHKFAFYSGEPEYYASILAGRTVGEASGKGLSILVPVNPGYALVLGVGGERILLHQDSSTLPKKHQLLLEFTDGTYLSVSVQGWGALWLMENADVDHNPYVGLKRVSPISDAFSCECFLALFDGLEVGDPISLKRFIISERGVHGIGNGYLQDILFRAGIHPQRRAADLSNAERRSLYEAIRKTMLEAVELGGRDSERDLHNKPGGYSRILDSRSAGRPCPNCGTSIEKISFQGGSCYFCPRCQGA